ncbi:Uncharacterized protein OBRU01_24726, partial [Operophtera brumata]
MSITINSNVVSGPEERPIPAHLSFGQFMFDQLKTGGDNVALLGVKRGDVVTLSSENRFEFMIASLGVMYCGAVLSTLNITYSPAQNVYDCSKDLPYVEQVIIFGDFDVIPGLMFNDLIKEYVDVDSFVLEDVDGAQDALAVMCSSGTTGLPKGTKSSDIVTAMSLIPWFHAYGFITTFAVMAMNLKIVFLIRFEEQQFLETIQNYKVNMTTLVPPLAVFLAKHPLVSQYDLTSLVEVWCGAAPLSSEIQKA